MIQLKKKNGRVLGLITATNVSRFLMRRKIWNTILFILEEFENPPIYDNLRLIYIYIYECAFKRYTYVTFIGYWIHNKVQQRKYFTDNILLCRFLNR